MTLLLYILKMKNYDDSIQSLWTPFQSKKDILEKLDQCKKEHEELYEQGELYSCQTRLGYLVPDEEGDECYTREYEADEFGNEGSILEIKENYEVSDLQYFVENLKEYKEKLQSENKEKLEEIENQLKQYHS